MERFSWQVHFRNRKKLRRDWHSIPISGTIGEGRSRRFFIGGYPGNSSVCKDGARSVSLGRDKKDAASRVSKGDHRERSKLLEMHLADQIRRWRRVSLCSLLCLTVHGLAIAQTEASTSPKKPAHATASPAKTSKHHTSGHTASKRTSVRTSTLTAKSSRGKKGSKKRGQQAIDSARAREIQTALIREHYMQGEPSESWDSTTQAAMQRYQADHGWQSKTTPDSRALIKLGLGPSHDHLLNPESAMTAAPAAGDPKAGAKKTPAGNNLPQH